MAYPGIRSFFEMVAATTQFFLMTMISVIGPLTTVYVIFFTRYWFIAIIYLIWIWVVDKDISERGGRTIDWVRGWKLYEYARDYYPVKITATPGLKFDPKRNYLFGYFPHGIMANGGVIALTSKACGVDKLFPNHKTHALTLHTNFRIPIYRDYLLSMGICSVTPKSINWLLSYPGGGKIALIVVGGAAEALYANPGVYKIVLKNRKGFVKYALINGAPLVPVFSFGEVDVFKQLVATEGSLLRYFQDRFKSATGVACPMFMGRGYVQGYVGFIPLNTPITVVIGNPIDVERNTNPTQKDIDDLHKIFMEQLNDLFEKYKYECIENPKSTTLTMV